VVHLFFTSGGDAAHRANIKARSVLNPDTGFSDYKSQSILVLSKTLSRTGGTTLRFKEFLGGWFHLPTKAAQSAPIIQFQGNGLSGRWPRTG
jgi:hypothetical protein